MKKKNKKNKALLVVTLILCITIGYAALTTTLNITGNSEIKNAKWDIHFANLVVDDTSVEATTPAAIDSNKTTVNYTVNLVKPGDSYSFAVDVVNEGTIDGMISTVTNTGLTAEQQKYVEYSITYDDGTELKVKDGLKAGAKKNVKVKVKYRDDINPEDLPKANETLNLTFTVEYVQADDTVTSPTPIMKTYTYDSTDDYHNSTYKSKVTKIVTKTNIDVPATAKEHWDVSAAGDGSVIAYVEDDGTENGTYKVTIGGDGGKVVANEDSNNLFSNFTSLKEIDLSSFDTSKVTNMSGMFEYCTRLTNLDVSNLDTSKVTNMGWMFYGCSSLNSLDLNNFDTSKVTNMRLMFGACSKLTSLDVSSFDTRNVTNMSVMFENCTRLTNLDVSSFDTRNVTNMSEMFENCSILTSLDLSSFDTSKVTDMNQMFYKCSSLTSLDLSKLNTSQVTNMNHMFDNCSSLTSLNLSNFDTSKLTNMAQMFYECSSLTSLDLSSFNTSQVTYMSHMFNGCSSLTCLDLSSFDTSKVTNMCGMFENCSSLISLDLSNFDTSNVINMSRMFYNCKKLTTSITVRNSNISSNSYKSMFYDAAMDDGAKITVNYISATSNLVDDMITQRSMFSNIIKGSLVS